MRHKLTDTVMAVKVHVCLYLSVCLSVTVVYIITDAESAQLAPSERM